MRLRFQSDLPSIFVQASLTNKTNDLPEQNLQPFSLQTWTSKPGNTFLFLAALSFL